MVDLQLPPPEVGSGAAYLRSIPRHEMDIAVAGVGCGVIMDQGVIIQARIALSAVAPVPLLANQAAESLVGETPTDSAMKRAAEIAAEEASPIDDVRGSANLRRKLVSVLTARALAKAVERAEGGRS